MFQATDQRCRLYERLEAFVREAKLSGIVTHILVDGSFVTGKAVSNDIDVIVVVPRGHDFDAKLGALA
jgi:predicted nucleotidyltransferase